MKTASELKQNVLNPTENLANKELDEISNAMEQASKNGHLKATFVLKHNSFETIKQQLESLGYSVTKERNLVTIDWS